jgi:hypothetical protein
LDRAAKVQHPGRDRAAQSRRPQDRRELQKGHQTRNHQISTSGNSKFWVYRDVELPTASGQKQKLPALIALIDDTAIKPLLKGKQAAGLPWRVRHSRWEDRVRTLVGPRSLRIAENQRLAADGQNDAADYCERARRAPPPSGAYESRLTSGRGSTPMNIPARNPPIRRLFVLLQLTAQLPHQPRTRKLPVALNATHRDGP